MSSPSFAFKPKKEDKNGCKCVLRAAEGVISVASACGGHITGVGVTFHSDREERIT